MIFYSCISKLNKGTVMNEQELEVLMDKNQIDAEYSEYLMNESGAFICNGDMLIEAIESGRYYEGFKDYMTGATA